MNNENLKVAFVGEKIFVASKKNGRVGYAFTTREEKGVVNEITEISIRDARAWAKALTEAADLAEAAA